MHRKKMQLPSFKLNLIFVLLFCANIARGEEVDNLRQIRQTETNPTTTQNPSTTTEPLPVTASLSLKDLILILMTKHGNAQTALAFNSLDSRSLGEIMRVLLVEVDKPLAEDIVAMQSYAQNTDKQLVALIARITTGDSNAPKDIFEWDDKLRKFPWWARIRQRMFINLDRFVKNYNPEADLAKLRKQAARS